MEDGKRVRLLMKCVIVLLFPATDAPHYKYGYAICAGFIGAAIVCVGIILLLIRADL